MATISKFAPETVIHLAAQPGVRIPLASSAIYVRDNLDAFSKRIMYLKYDNEFNKIRSNKIIGELMCCSEENIRQNLRKTLQKIQ